MAQGRGMTPTAEPREDYEAKDAMHTLLRAHEITKNKHLMGRVRKHAKAHAAKMAEQAHHAARLAKSGHISDKQMKKLHDDEGMDATNLDKMKALA